LDQVEKSLGQIELLSIDCFDKQSDEDAIHIIKYNNKAYLNNKILLLHDIKKQTNNGRDVPMYIE